jgi:cell division protease FtsH
MSMQTDDRRRAPVPTHKSRPKESDRTTRRPMVFWDRAKVLLLLLLSFGTLVWSDSSNVPIKAVRDSFRDVATNYWWLLALAGLEVLRQLNYLIQEHSTSYYRFWNTLFSRWHARLDRTNDFTRFRLGRVVKFLIFLFILDKLLAALFDVPEPALISLPALIVRGLPMIFQVVFIMFIAVGQFAAIFWFLSRGGVDTYMPDDLETRFSDVKGQDPVLERVQENMIFLDDPESIEERGGYVPGGLLLWGPPGTGKTLMAQAVAGETAKPFVFVDPGAFVQMFMGVGILKVKSLYRKLRKLAVRYGGVIVFFDEADSLGNRGSLGAQGGGWKFGAGAGGSALDPGCNGLAYLPPASRDAIVRSEMGAAKDPIIMGGMGMGGGMGTLQALLSEMSGLKKPRGFVNRYIRRLLGMKPKPPPKYRILHIFATNMPQSLDEAMLRPGRIDRIYKVGYPSKEGRLETFRGYLETVKHNLTGAQVEQLATMTPYYSGAKIKDLVNEGLILAIRDDRDTIEWQDVWKARSLKELGPPEDVEYIQRERHAVAIHEASHAVAAHLLRAHRMIDLVSIEKRQTTLGMVASLDIEDRVTQWKTELEIDIKVSLASLAGERMFFGGDNSSGVSNDLRSATHLTSLMEGVFGMGTGITSLAGLPQNVISQTPDPTGKVVRRLADRVEQRLQELYDEVYELLEQHRDDLVRLARVLEERKTISGDEVAEVMGSPAGSWTAHFPQGFAAVNPEPLPTDGDGSGNGSGDGKIERRSEEPVAGD